MISPSESHLAPYATGDSGDAVARKHAEPQEPLCRPFEVDRHRIVASTAFRRLEHKTQVFAPTRHDHFRTRLTHTLEAAMIARILARHLRVNADLAEAITLAHDLGHPPFGHAGEAALAEAMASHGGFNHNTHALRVVDVLEHPYPAFRGLNLTAATGAGLLTHATRYDRPAPRAAGFSPRGPADPVQPNENGPSSEVLPDSASIEAQVASIADRIAYNVHDLEDAIGAGYVTLVELTKVALWQEAYKRVTQAGDPKNIFAIRRPVLDAILERLLEDVIETSQRSLSGDSSSASLSPESPEPRASARATPRTRVGATGSSNVPARLSIAFSPVGEKRLTELETFLFTQVYQHPDVAQMDAHGREMILALFETYRTRPHELPQRFTARIDNQGLDRVICDYIAGMTDRFCHTEHARLVQANVDRPG